MADFTLQADVIVVGTGPGGDTCARQLARAGKKVLLLERGSDYRSQPYYGTYPGALIYADRMSLLFTVEGLNIVRPLMVGGVPVCIVAVLPRRRNRLKRKYGVDIDAEVTETLAELEIAPLPEDLRGQASTHIAQAAQALGYHWEPQAKFMRPGRTRKFDCGAKCMLVVVRGKMDAAEWVDQVSGRCGFVSQRKGEPGAYRW